MIQVEFQRKLFGYGSSNIGYARERSDEKI